MEEAREFFLRDGCPAIIRPIVASDRQAMAEAFKSLSEESRFRRFFFNKSTLTDRELERLANPDGVNHIALGVAAISEDGKEEPISVGHCFREKPESDLAEIAVVTADLWQGNGAGSELVKALAEASLTVGIKRWLAVTLPENTEMRKILGKIGSLVDHKNAGGGVIEEIYTIDLN